MCIFCSIFCILRCLFLVNFELFCCCYVIRAHVFSLALFILHFQNNLLYFEKVLKLCYFFTGLLKAVRIFRGDRGVG